MFFVFLTASLPAWTIFSCIVSFDRSDEVELSSPPCDEWSWLSLLFIGSMHDFHLYTSRACPSKALQPLPVKEDAYS